MRSVKQLALAAIPARPSGVHDLAGDATFAARDYVCRHGARSPAFEGVYARARIAVILGGAFHARTSEGRALVGPGALLLGNAAGAYEYRHVDDGGDRSLAFDYDAAVLAEVAAAVGARLRGARAFRRACVPASAGSADAVMLAHEALMSGDLEAYREAALAVAAVALAADRDSDRDCDGGFDRRTDAPAARAQVAQTMRHIEAHGDEDCSLAALAARAGLSSYHFLRVFRALTGQTPRQFVIATRLRAAALALRTTTTPVTRVAIDAGFGDLSHFHASFARAFGATPRIYRLRRAITRTRPGSSR